MNTPYCSGSTPLRKTFQLLLFLAAVSLAIVILLSAAVLQYLLQLLYNAYCSGCVIPMAAVLEYLLQR